MSHAARRQRVMRARAELASQLDRTRQQALGLQDSVRQSVTPARLLTAGVLGGFVSGLLRLERLPHQAGNLTSLLKTVLPAWQQLRAAQQQPDRPTQEPPEA